MTYLQLVLVVGVGVGEVAELLRELEAEVEVLRGDEVLGDLDAGVEVADLVRRAGRDEHRVPHALHDGVAHHVVLLLVVKTRNGYKMSECYYVLFFIPKPPRQ